MSLSRGPRQSGSDDGQAGPSYRPAIDALAFRRTLGHFATGVTVVTIYTDDGIHGMTANAFSSLSLDPPQILICVDRRAHTARYIRSSNAFAVNVLRQTQEPLSRLFANSWRFGSPPEHRLEEWAGAPYLVGSLGALSCRVADVFESGDHLIVVGRVVGLRVDEPNGEPLLFYRGQYGAFVARDDSPPEEPELISYDQIRVYYGEISETEEESTDSDRPVPSHPWFPGQAPSGS